MIYSEESKSGLIRRYKVVGGRRLSNYWWASVIFLGGCGFLLTGVSSYLNKNVWLLPFFSFNTIELLEKGTEFIGLTNGTPFVGTSFFPPTPWTSSLFPLMGDNGKEMREVVSSDPLTALCVHQNAKLIATVTTLSLFLPKMKFQVPEIKEVSIQLIDSVNKVNLSRELISNTSSTMQSMEKNLSFFPQGLVLCFYGILGLCFSFHLWFTIFWQIGGGFNEFNGEEKSVRVFRWGRPGKNRRIDLKYTNQSIEAIKVEITPRRALFLCVKGERNIPLTRVGEPIPLEEIEAQAAELTRFLQIPLEMGS